jgi:hypothetical protein
MVGRCVVHRDDENQSLYHADEALYGKQPPHSMDGIIHSPLIVEDTVAAYIGCF